ncbi:Crp/Fnr family transcriptional regulator [Pararoseomonas indoligenes]|uniref:Crp/Fnr family transcriptional regulator n=1 Tax=Roseomonas indoligenes TaxID=2820811 RepID=A0A940N7F6_9PROT|nr:Crp/Fnr family transcriptional regulator [Pararoseomonas indoligenes]MBP0496535.1 Crp/Fnr family transcriptional regulator [Pararoseomonas indoligenes]
MITPLIRKLSQAVDFSDDDLATLTRLTSRQRTVGPRTALIHEGDRPGPVRLIMKGLACRYQSLPDGSRQIVALLIPGDFCDLHVAILDRMDHSLGTLSNCDIVEIPRAAVLSLIETSPSITRALWWATLVDEAILRNWLVNKGRRQADLQLLNLFCELLCRYEVAGLAQGDTFPLPLTQEELSDVMGVSVVHANRTLNSLREAGLVTFEKGSVTFPDRARAYEVAEFDPTYLHLTRRR